MAFANQFKWTSEVYMQKKNVYENTIASKPQKKCTGKNSFIKLAELNHIAWGYVKIWQISKKDKEIIITKVRVGIASDGEFSD